MLDNNVLPLEEEVKEVSVTAVEGKPLASNKGFNIALCIVSCVLATVLLVMFFSAADAVKTGGLEIMSIESVGGKTLEEAYYHDLGFIYEGYCLTIQAMGVFCSSVLALFGVSRLKNGK